MVQVGQKVNGFTILAYAYRENNLSEVVILGKKDDEYVTAIMSSISDIEWYWGHYMYKVSYRSALDNFTKRVNNDIF